jgi:hypothetical protein
MYLFDFHGLLLGAIEQETADGHSVGLDGLVAMFLPEAR